MIGNTITAQNKQFSKQMRFDNRETNSTAFCVIQQMSIKPPLPSKQLK